MFQCPSSVYPSFRLLSRLVDTVNCNAPSSSDARKGRIVLSNNPIAPIYNQVLNARQRGIGGVVVANCENGLCVVIEFRGRLLLQQDGGISILYALVNSMGDGLKIMDDGKDQETILVDDRSKLFALLRYLQPGCEVMRGEACGYKVCKGTLQPPR